MVDRTAMQKTWKNRVQRRWGKIGKWFLGTLVALYAGYVVGVHWFLYSPTFPKLLGWGEGHIGFGKLRSFVPGWIWIDDFELINRDSTVHFSVRVQKLNFWVNLFALTERRFEVTSLTGDGVRFWLLERSLERDKNALPHLPPVPDVPNWKSDAGSGPPPEKPWKVQIGGMQLKHVDDLWFNQERFLGRGSIRGKFHIIVAGTEASVGPASLVLTDGKIWRSDHVVADNFSAQTDMRIEPFSGRNVEGDAVFRFFNVDLQGHARTNVSSIGNLLLAQNKARNKRPWIHVDSEWGDLAWQVRLKSGRWQAPSSVKFHSKRTGVRILGARLDGPTHLEWDVKEVSASRARSDLKIWIDPLRLIHGRKRYLSKGKLRVEGASYELDVAQGLFEDFSPKVWVENAIIPDLSVLNAHIPNSTPLKIERGSAKIDWFLEEKSGRGHGKGSLKASVRNTLVSFANERYQADVDLRIPLSKFDTNSKRFRVDKSKLKILKRSPKWIGDVRIHEGRLRWGKPMHGSLSAEGWFTDTRPFLNVFLHGGILAAAIRPFLVSGNLHTTVDLRINEKDLLEVPKFHLEADGLDFTGWMFRRGKAQHGAMLAKVGPFAVGVELLGANSRVILNDASTWYQRVEPFATPSPEALTR